MSIEMEIFRKERKIKDLHEKLKRTSFICERKEYEAISEEIEDLNNGIAVLSGKADNSIRIRIERMMKRREEMLREILSIAGNSSGLNAVKGKVRKLFFDEALDRTPI